jgi:hypothetical protein
MPEYPLFVFGGVRALFLTFLKINLVVSKIGCIFAETLKPTTMKKLILTSVFVIITSVMFAQKYDSVNFKNLSEKDQKMYDPKLYNIWRSYEGDYFLKPVPKSPKRKEPFSIKSMGIGLSTVYMPTLKNQPNVAFGACLYLNHIYFDVSLLTQYGYSYLDYSSSSSYNTRTYDVTMFNLGYIIWVKKISIIPTVGIYSAAEIWCDPIGMNTYYYGDGGKSVGTVGLHVAIPIYHTLKVNIGATSTKTINFSLTLGIGK